MSTSAVSRDELLRLRLRGRAKAKRDNAIGPAAREGALPLSFAQRRLWVLDQIQPASTEYLMPVLLRLRGKLDVPALRRALGEMVARHAVLRTRYSVVARDPAQ